MEGTLTACPMLCVYIWRSSAGLPLQGCGTAQGFSSVSRRRLVHWLLVSSTFFLVTGGPPEQEACRTAALSLQCKVQALASA